MWNNDDDSLLPFEVLNILRNRLNAERTKLKRVTLKGQVLDYKDRSDYGVDQLESARNFLDTVEKFVSQKASRLARTRSHVRMLPGDEDNENIDWVVADDGKFFFL